MLGFSPCPIARRRPKTHGDARPQSLAGNQDSG
ncbi:unnamed protein product [Cuscuta epithymum]|uniref:Uncharacterized protein n=1 Tax=Cuscuta epithymum TaxID=186058 RepID=A0AAV0CBU4_9ASTE|nr:unnamed protein product [Cuscuta epithymum]CAH9148541.1 unnamed protein product [Cuscuta epithymum]